MGGEAESNIESIDFTNFGTRRRRAFGRERGRLSAVARKPLSPKVGGRGRKEKSLSLSSLVAVESIRGSKTWIGLEKEGRGRRRVSDERQLVAPSRRKCRFLRLCGGRVQHNSPPATGERRTKFRLSNVRQPAISMSLLVIPLWARFFVFRPHLWLPHGLIKTKGGRRRLISQIICCLGLANTHFFLLSPRPTSPHVATKAAVCEPLSGIKCPFLL